MNDVIQFPYVEHKIQENQSPNNNLASILVEESLDTMTEQSYFNISNKK